MSVISHFGSQVHFPYIIKLFKLGNNLSSHVIVSCGNDLYFCDSRHISGAGMYGLDIVASFRIKTCYSVENSETIVDSQINDESFFHGTSPLFLNPGNAGEMYSGV